MPANGKFKKNRLRACRDILHAFRRTGLAAAPDANDLRYPINTAIEREDAARRPLTRADIQTQIESLLRQEQEAMCRSQPRRR